MFPPSTEFIISSTNYLKNKCMRFFNLKDKDRTLINLHGNKPKIKFDNGGLTTSINKVRKHICEELHKRNYDIPGLEVGFFHNVLDDGSHIIKVFSVTCVDPKLAPDVDIRSNTHVRSHGMDLSLYEDMSGSLEVYCGSDWESDRDEFVNGIRFHRKMNNKNRIVLRYETDRGKKFVYTDDCGRGYIPDGSPSEPLSYSMVEIEMGVIAGLESLRSYIAGFPEKNVDHSLFTEPDPQFLTNLLFSETEFHSTISSNVADRMLNDGGNQGTDVGWRLLPLGVKAPKDHPYHEIMNDGFIYCDIANPGSPANKYNWHYDGMDNIKVIVRLRNVNEVYVVDASVSDRFRDEWFKNNPDCDSLTNEAYNELIVARARTMVHINDYTGGYDKPVILIGRSLAKDEIIRLITIAK